MMLLTCVEANLTAETLFWLTTVHRQWMNYTRMSVCMLFAADRCHFSTKPQFPSFVISHYDKKNDHRVAFEVTSTLVLPIRCRFYILSPDSYNANTIPDFFSLDHMVRYI